MCHNWEAIAQAGDLQLERAGHSWHATPTIGEIRLINSNWLIQFDSLPGPCTLVDRLDYLDAATSFVSVNLGRTIFDNRGDEFFEHHCVSVVADRRWI
jgi:hypothetical protein